MSDERLIRIEDKLDKTNEHLNAIDITLAKQAEQLEIHIKRTNLLEENLKPVQNHVIMVSGVLKFLGALAITSGAIEGIVALLAYIRN